MATPAAKRRRIDEASQTLSKPFRSPFKTPFKSPLKITSADTTTLQCNTLLLPTSKNPLALDPANSPSLPVPSSSIATPRQRPTEKSFTSPIAAAALNADPDIAPLLRQRRELEKQLRELKEELDTAQQAKKIEDSSRKKIPDGDIDAELVELTTKWKAASRQAAEELFGQVRDRVNR
jgi:Swi5-dependent recombination DNA repair protein 1